MCDLGRSSTERLVCVYKVGRRGKGKIYWWETMLKLNLTLYVSFKWLLYNERKTQRHMDHTHKHTQKYMRSAGLWIVAIKSGLGFRFKSMSEPDLISFNACFNHSPFWSMQFGCDHQALLWEFTSTPVLLPVFPDGRFTRQCTVWQ